MKLKGEYGVPVSQRHERWTTWTRRTTPGGWQRLPEVLRAWVFSTSSWQIFRSLGKPSCLGFSASTQERNANKEKLSFFKKGGHPTGSHASCETQPSRDFPRLFNISHLSASECWQLPPCEGCHLHMLQSTG